MSKANQFLKGEDAVSPVIGVILMVAITVILAAVIAAFVFGMGPPEQAPQASLRASAVDINGNNTVKLEHQGGDNFYLSDTNTLIIVDGTTVGSSALASDYEFSAGKTVYLYNDTNNATLTLGLKSNAEAVAAADQDDVAAAGSTVNVKVVDTASQQMIGDMDVRF
jgi:flagellin-like protein